MEEKIVNIYELIGFIIGDGNIYYNRERGVYRLELAGNAEEDYDYFEQIMSFLIEYTGKKPIMFVRKEKFGKSLRIQFNNKDFVDKLVLMGLPIGKKTFDIIIPENFIKDEEIMWSVLRGLFEADGCLYFSKSKKHDYPTYPRLEIKSSSVHLVEQVCSFFRKEGFVVYVKKPKSDKTFAILLSGEMMLNKWIEKVGLVSLKNKTKYDLWKSKGFYIPNTALKDRLEICAGIA